MGVRYTDAVQAHLRRLAEAAGAAAGEVAAPAARYADWVVETLTTGGRLFLCGNGGSAATTEHIAAEYSVRFRRLRGSLPALALSSSTAALTAAANDFGFEHVFARALAAHARPGDLLVLHSTSGASRNLLEAAAAARDMAVRTVALLGRSDGGLADLVDLAIHVPADETAVVQEIHLALEHCVADLVDAHFAAADGEAVT